MDYKQWGLALEDSCREKTHGIEPPLVASFVPPLLWLCSLRTLHVTDSPRRQDLKYSRSDWVVATSTVAVADRSVSTER